MYRVLVVDDIQCIRLMAKRILNRMGVDHVDEAENGLEAAQMLAKNGPYHLVITDWNMPDSPISGLDLVKAVRKASAKLPIVMLTSSTDSDDVLAAAKAGVNDYIVKPFTAQHFKQRINGVFEKAYQKIPSSLSGPPIRSQDSLAATS